MARSTNRRTVQNAKALRREMTLPEVRLWQVLRGKPQDLKFRRQHPIGPFVVDFYCASAKLAIEIDGKVHDMGAQPASDAVRGRFLKERGVETLRIPAAEVLKSPEDVAEAICLRCLAD